MSRLLHALIAVAIACAAGCGGDDCNKCPQVGATQCSGTQVQTCTADANGCRTLSAAKPCGLGSFCSATTNACAPCVNQCVLAGTSQCAGTTQQQPCTADVNGCLSLGAPTACAAGETCVANQGRCMNTTGVTCSQPPVLLTSQSTADPSTTCQLPIGTSSLPAGQIVQHVPSARIGTPVTFTIPPGTGSFSIVSQAVNATTSITLSSGGQSFTLPNSVVPRFVTEPGGAPFYDDNVIPNDPATALAFYGGLSPSTGAFTVPDTTAGLAAFASGVPPGTWNMTVGDFALECGEITDPTLTCTGASTTNTYDITVLTRPLAGATGTVDVGIYLVTNSLVFGTAANAVANASVQRFVSTLQTLYARAGLCLGNVTFYDVSAAAKATFAKGVNAAQTDPCSELDQMFTLSLPGKNEISFFFVDDIVQPTGATGQTSVVGIDGTIPGPSSIGGTVHSGAAVNAANLAKGTCGASLDFLHCGADLTAYIAAHEGGHFMGLYHTTEGFGDAFDPVTDTGQCPCTVCATPASAQSQCFDASPNVTPTNPTQMEGRFCTRSGSCDGSQYLMFWLIDETSVGILSPQQGQIVRTNPVVR